MRPVCLLGRTKNLHQSDRLHFISDSLIPSLTYQEAQPVQTWQPGRYIHLNVNNPSVYPEGRRTISLCKQRSSLLRFKYKKIITQDRSRWLMILCKRKEIPNAACDKWNLCCGWVCRFILLLSLRQAVVVLFAHRFAPLSSPVRTTHLKYFLLAPPRQCAGKRSLWRLHANVLHWQEYAPHRRASALGRAFPTLDNIRVQK